MRFGEDTTQLHASEENFLSSRSDYRILASVQNIRVVNIGTNYGQVAQADRGATVTQTQTYSTFDGLRALVGNHVELTEEETRRIIEVLSDLENTAKEGGLTKRIQEAKEAFTKYGWLLEPLVTVLKATLGLSSS